MDPDLATQEGESSSTTGSGHERQAPCAEKRLTSRKQMTREEYIECLESRYVKSLSRLSSANANKTQLQQLFLNHYMPLPVDAYQKYVNPLPVIISIAQSAGSPALENATKAVSAMVIHRTCDDPRLVRGATVAYCRAISQARRELQGTQRPDRSTMVAMTHMLTVFELFNSVSLEDIGGGAHSFWFLFLTKPGQEDVIPIDAKLRTLLSSNMRLFAMTETLIAEKCPFPIGCLVDESQQCLSTTPSTLTNLGLMVATAVQAANAICEQSTESNPDLEEILNQFEELVRLEGKLHEWMNKYIMTISRAPYWRIPSNAQAYGPMVRGTPQLFPHLYEFADYHTAVVHHVYWMCLLVLAQAHNSVVETYYYKLDWKKGGPALRKPTNEYANSLGMTVLFLGRSQYGMSARLAGIRPLVMLYRYYKSIQDWPKVAWCVHCAEDLGLLRQQPCSSKP